MNAESSQVEKLLNPQSIGLVGVSTRESEAYQAGGRAILRHLLTYGYSGRLFPVHREAEDIHGLQAYASLDQLPMVPECVVVAVATGAVEAILTECAAIGVQSALIVTGGFSELDAEGACLESRLRILAHKGGVRFIGPNSTGIINILDGVAMSMTSVLSEGAQFQPGGLAFIAQSGALSSSLVERARIAGHGFSHLVSIGNQGDLTTGDVLNYFASDTRVQAASLYLESIKERESLVYGLDAMRTAGKPVVALLGGRGRRGEEAAASHTGKLVGRSQIELALLQSEGVHMVEDLDDLWRIGNYFAANTPRPSLVRWAVFTYSGGMGVLTVDELEKGDAQLSRFTSQTRERITAMLPSYLAAANPLDIGPAAMPSKFQPLLELVVSDANVDAVCIPIPMGAAGWHEAIVDAVIEVASATYKPIIVSWYGGDTADPHIRSLRSHGILTVETPIELGRIVRVLSGAGGVQNRTSGAARKASLLSSSGSLGGFKALALLDQNGLDVVETVSCTSAAGAIEAATTLGYPVVVKSGNEEISHRLELGLVQMGIATPQDIEEAVSEIADALVSAGLEPSFIVQRQIPQAREIILTVRDAGSLGIFAGVGYGGSLVELLDEIAFFPLPATVADVESAVHRIRGGEALLGYRGEPAVDIQWILRTVNSLAEVMRSNGFKEIETNPAIVGASGGMIIDALVVPSLRSDSFC